LGCIARQNGLVIALAMRPEALEEDCTRADLVISAAPAFFPATARSWFWTQGRSPLAAAMLRALRRSVLSASTRRVANVLGY
jgi:hypothetical protein